MFPAIVLSLALAQGEPIASRRAIPTEVFRCDECGVRVSSVDAAIRCLATSPRDEVRESAVRALGSVKRACHPEVVTVLSDALLHDPDWSVREGAADSLARLDACDPEAHEALARAAVRDPKLCVRLKARKGLKAIDRRCDAPCAVCDRAMVLGPARSLGPIRGLIPSIDIAVPGVRLHLGPRRPIVLGPPVVVEPPIVVEPEGTPPPPSEPDLRPIPGLDDAPPPRPQPSPFGSTPPDPMPTPAEPPLSRSSHKPASPAPSRPSAPTPKPVTPETDLPPLVGPSGSSG